MFARVMLSHYTICSRIQISASEFEREYDKPLNPQYLYIRYIRRITFGLRGNYHALSIMTGSEISAILLASSILQHNSELSTDVNLFILIANAKFVLDA